MKREKKEKIRYYGMIEFLASESGFGHASPLGGEEVHEMALADAVRA
jgi:hypothetical protein